jgi:hypothetical protein
MTRAKRTDSPRPSRKIGLRRPAELAPDPDPIPSLAESAVVPEQTLSGAPSMEPSVIEELPNGTLRAHDDHRVFYRKGYGGRPARQVKSTTIYLQIDIFKRLDVYLASQLRKEDRSAFIERAITLLLDKETGTGDFALLNRLDAIYR